MGVIFAPTERDSELGYHPHNHQPTGVLIYPLTMVKKSSSLFVCLPGRVDGYHPQLFLGLQSLQYPFFGMMVSGMS